MNGVGYIRDEVRRSMDKWFLIRDCLSGQEAIKAATTSYLPKPNAYDVSTENESRYKQYVERAVFYNVTQRTHGGLVGQVFRRPPIMLVPKELEVLLEDLDGAGVTLVQQSKRALGNILGYGRAGLFVDYPVTDQAVTVEEIQSGFIRPTVTLFEPWEILNWRTKKVGARLLLSLVVLRESATVEDDGFELKKADVYRVLRLSGENIYTVEIHSVDDKGEPSIRKFTPLDANGQPFNEIPFIFIGALNNDTSVDLPPLYDLAVLNIAHYRNSADYEESCFIVGQPTPYFSGLTREWVEDVFKSRVIQLGSRAAVPLPEGADAGLLQASSNSMPREAMELKEKQMISLGAKLVEQSTVQRTATEARQEEASEASILSTCAQNVSHAYQKALIVCCQFSGCDTSEVRFELNTEFDLAKMSSTEIQQVVANWQSGAVTFYEMRESLRKAGYTQVSAEEAKKTIASEPPPQAASKNNVGKAGENFGE